MSASVANISAPTTLVKGGTIVTASDQFEADILVRGETIAVMGRELEVRTDAVVDAKGCYVFPGAVQTHFSNQDFESAALAALQGGVTTLLDQAPPVDRGGLFGGLRAARERNQGKSAIDYAFHSQVAFFDEGTRAEIRELIEEEGVSSFEVAMNPPWLQALMVETSCWGGIVRIHAESDQASFENRDRAGDVLDLTHAGGHPVCLASVTFENTLNRLREVTLRNQRAWAETRVECLFDDECRSPDDQDALWAGLRQGLVHVVGSGPHDLEVLHSEGVAKGRLSLQKLVEVCATLPARIYGLPGKGSVGIGSDADLVIFDPFAPHEIPAYPGRMFRGRVRSVLVRGMLAFDNGRVFERSQGFGRCLVRAKHLPDKL